MKKHPIAVKLFLLLFLSVVVAIVYGVRGLYDARVRFHSLDRVVSVIAEMFNIAQHRFGSPRNVNTP